MILLSHCSKLLFFGPIIMYTTVSVNVALLEEEIINVYEIEDQIG